MVAICVERFENRFSSFFSKVKNSIVRVASSCFWRARREIFLGAENVCFETDLGAIALPLRRGDHPVNVGTFEIVVAVDTAENGFCEVGCCFQ